MSFDPRSDRDRQRRRVLGGLLLLFVALGVVVLLDIFATVFFAITVAYVLLPVRTRLVSRGFSRFIAGTITAGLALLAALVAIVPLAGVLYLRLDVFLALLDRVPGRVRFGAGGFEYAIGVDNVFGAVREALSALAVQAVEMAPIIALKLMVFAFLVFVLLVRSEEIRAAILGVIPADYHDIARALHGCVATTLYSIYVLQVATALGTAVVALVVFVGLGYEAAFSLAVVAGVLQFFPIVGPSVLVVGLAAYEAALGDPTRAAAVAEVGLFFIGFLPDAVIRPHLARSAIPLPSSLYFVGFAGGGLTIGVVGFILGPLVLALLVVTVELLSAEATEDGSPTDTTDETATAATATRSLVDRIERIDPSERSEPSHHDR